ncbi:hypothetical protein SAMN04487866_10490 [Thermoactinomyces sp. DSM 45891]|uniref:hypothetical protein n=1 Tax=Thermoactinomyces sp. DSM 45891 TaxID=1761907 RepID=UPI00091407D8|nr:hypothetical protein [Thermoactinomyces sp. DSM 45891]SFX31434.1 hypothetical protein SAMN04487866_10490 [Thermoactinomyces sp. DSM 45891]
MNKKVVGTLVAAGMLVTSMGAASATWFEGPNGNVWIGANGKGDHYSTPRPAGHGGGDPKTQLVRVTDATSRVFCMTNDNNKNNISAQKQCVQDTTTALHSSAYRNQMIMMHFETAYNNPEVSFFDYSWAP